MEEKKIQTTVNNGTEMEMQETTIKSIPFPPVEALEKAAKVGFYCEKRDDDDSMLEDLVRLRCESKDPDQEDTILTPWCSAATLGAMVQGCLYLNPLIIKCIKDNQKNAPTPEE